MKEKFSIVAITAVITALFATTLVLSLTVQPVAALTCSPKNPNVCAGNNVRGATSGANTNNAQVFANAVPPQGQAANNQGVGGGPDAFTGGGTCGSFTPEVILNGKTTCAG